MYKYFHFKQYPLTIKIPTQQIRNKMSQKNKLSSTFTYESSSNQTESQNIQPQQNPSQKSIGHQNNMYSSPCLTLLNTSSLTPLDTETTFLLEMGYKKSQAHAEKFSIQIIEPVINSTVKNNPPTKINVNISGMGPEHSLKRFLAETKAKSESRSKRLKRFEENGFELKFSR